MKKIKGEDGHVEFCDDAGELAAGHDGAEGCRTGEPANRAAAGAGVAMRLQAGEGQAPCIGREIPQPVKMMLEDLKLLQAQIDALPGPRLHQDHDFSGDFEALETLYGWLRETAWTPYWGQPPEGVATMMFLGGRDPWIETLEMRLWTLLENLAVAAGCELTGRGAVCPEDEELEVIHVMYPQIAEANGWVFSSQGNVLQ